MTRSAVALAVAALLPSCAMEAPFADGGDGTLSISTEIKGDVVKNTRAIDSDEMAALRENFVIWICNSKGVVKRFKGVDNIPESFSLKVGSYVADAWAGDSVSASFDKKFYSQGEQRAQSRLPHRQCACQRRSGFAQRRSAGHEDHVLQFTWRTSLHRRQYRCRQGLFHDAQYLGDRHSL